MLELARSGRSYDLGDQGVLNAYLTEQDLWGRAGELRPDLNMPSCVRPLGDWEKHQNDIRAMHYLGPRKPGRDTPEHEWFHADTKKLWDDEIAHHNSPPKRGRPNMASSLHTKIVRMVQRYEKWRGKHDPE